MDDFSGWKPLDTRSDREFESKLVSFSAPFRQEKRTCATSFGLRKYSEREQKASAGNSGDAAPGPALRE